MFKLTKETTDSIRRGNWIPKFVTPAILIWLGTQTVEITKYLSQMNDRAFSTVEMRVKTEEHINKAWTPLQTHQAMERLIYVEESVERLQKIDSISAEDRKEMKIILARIEKTLEKTTK